MSSQYLYTNPLYPFLNDYVPYYPWEGWWVFFFATWAKIMSRIRSHFQGKVHGALKWRKNKQLNKLRGLQPFGELPLRPNPFRPMPFRPTPLGPIPNLANSHLDQCHLGQNPFRPMPFRPKPISAYAISGQNPLWPMPFRPMPFSPMPFGPIAVMANAILANAISANSLFGQFSLVSMRIGGMHNRIILTSCRISYLIYCLYFLGGGWKWPNEGKVGGEEKVAFICLA